MACKGLVDTALHAHRRKMPERTRRSLSFIFHPWLKDETMFQPWLKDEGFGALNMTRPTRKVEKRLARWTFFLRQDWEFSCVEFCPATAGPFSACLRRLADNFGFVLCQSRLSPQQQQDRAS